MIVEVPPAELTEYERGLRAAWLAVHPHRFDDPFDGPDSIYQGVTLAEAAIEALGDAQRIRGY